VEPLRPPIRRRRDPNRLNLSRVNRHSTTRFGDPGVGLYSGGGCGADSSAD